MKFTEGYWEKNERANASYAMQAFTAEAIPGGMRIVSPRFARNRPVMIPRISPVKIAAVICFLYHE